MQLTYFKDKDFYFFKVPYHQRDTILVDGKSLPQEVPYYKEIEVTSKTLPKIELVVTKTNVIAYKDSKGAEITPEAYQLTIIALTAGATEDEGQLVFDDLDEEYKYKKFVREYQAVYGTTSTITEVKTTVVQAMISTGSPYLSAVFRTDSDNPHLVSYNKSQHQLDVVRAWDKTNGVNVEIPTHSHLKYAKVNGKYVFDAQYEKATPELIPYEQAYERMREVETGVKSCLNSAIIQADSVTLVDLLKRVKSMKDKTAVSSGKSTKDALNALRTELSAVQKELEELTLVKDTKP
jgi:hypothetical protein